jgi:hypothetical protein
MAENTEYAALFAEPVTIRVELSTGRQFLKSVSHRYRASVICTGSSAVRVPT